MYVYRVRYLYYPFLFSPCGRERTAVPFIGCQCQSGRGRWAWRNPRCCRGPASRFRIYFCVSFLFRLRILRSCFLQGSEGGATLHALCLFNICSGCRHGSSGSCFRTHGFKFSLCLFANPTDLYQFVSKQYRFFFFETFSPLFLTLCKFITYKYFGQSFLKKF